MVEKIQLIDDLAHSAVSRYALVGAPLAQPAWDLLVELCLRVTPSGHDWSFGKVNHISPYGNLPLFCRGQQYISVAVRNPRDNAFYAFAPTTQIFGPTASVLRYNATSRLIVTILIRVFDIPDIGYYEDYGVLAPNVLVVCTVCALLGIAHKGDKIRISGKNNFLGPAGPPHCEENNFAISNAWRPGKSSESNAGHVHRRVFT